MTLSERCKAVMPPMADRATDLGIVKAEGCYLYTEDGRKILDFAAGIAVCNVGHSHPKVVAAAKKQMDTLIHACHNVMYYDPYVTLAEKLVALCGGNKKVYFANSGAEANECAIKLAKFATKRPVIISMKNAFHGRTLACASITTSSAQYRKNYEPMLPSIYFAEYPNLFRTPYKMVDGKCPKEYMTQFDDMFKKIVDPSLVAAIMMEPIQGEGGYVLPPVEWLQYVRDICTKHGIMLIFDEVQTGFGRTGNLFAWQTLGVEPDIFTSAKGIAGGFPLSAVIGKKEIMDKWEKGAHGGTFGGNAVSCAASMAVLEVLFEDGGIENCRKMGEVARAGLKAIQQKFPKVVGDVRGVGLFNAIEFVKEDNAPDGALCTAIVAECAKRDMLLLTCGADKNVIRLMPELTIPEEELKKGLAILEEAVAAAVAAR